MWITRDSGGTFTYCIWEKEPVLRDDGFWVSGGDIPDRDPAVSFFRGSGRLIVPQMPPGEIRKIKSITINFVSG